MSEHLEHVKSWVASFRHDVEAVKAVVDAEGVDARARKHAAAALSYLVTRLDLVPDWNDTIGVMDDVMVLRICLELASAYGVDSLPDEARARVEGMVRDVAAIEALLGSELYGKLRKHCARLSDTAVRGRTPEGIVEDASARQALYREVEDEIVRMPAATFEDDAALVKFTSYLHHKLS